MGRKPKSVDEINEQQASHILQQHKNKSLKRKKLNDDVNNLRETIKQLQDKLNELEKQHSTLADDSEETF